ncbi:MAG: sirohydrochlorin ferrochelatase [Myxococcota bacterium]|jgi:sirohydrochlorin ferrochelatase
MSAHSPTTGLILLAHGSRREAANVEVRELAAEMAQRTGAGWAHAAFLELATPTLPDAVGYLIEQGATEVVVLPMFLNRGRHVTRDVPGLQAQATTRFPDIPIRVLPHLGDGDSFKSFVSRCFQPDEP